MQYDPCQPYFGSNSTCLRESDNVLWHGLEREGHGRYAKLMRVATCGATDELSGAGMKRAGERQPSSVCIWTMIPPCNDKNGTVSVALAPDNVRKNRALGTGWRRQTRDAV